MTQLRWFRKHSFRRMAVMMGATLVLFAMGTLLALRYVPSHKPSPPVTHPDPLVRQHEILKRSNEAYALRIESIRKLRASGLAAGNPRSVEDEILTAARELITLHGPQHACAMATRRLVLIAPRVSATCAKVGIALGPNVVPDLIEARTGTTEERRRLAELVAEYQFAEEVRALCTAAALEKEQKPPPNDGTPFTGIQSP
ncbi:MAG: hypothetical protein N2Z21_08635 [Candidatus Sumerlaeaceae bacterium]|nr:hypothetical protein [Candidatus Sumerlaeaceae bacterium]